MKILSGAMARVAAALCAAMVVLGGFAAEGLSAAEPAAKPAPAVRVWTGDVAANEYPKTASGTLRPVSIVGARNGTFSGKIVVESRGVITGLRAKAGRLSADGADIPAANVQVRYAVAWERRNWGWPSYPDILLESPPEEVRPYRKGPAFVPVWITVKVPRDAKVATYTGELVVEAEGTDPVTVPLRLEIQDWTLPDPQDYRTWIDFIQSPDTLALEYKVPLWSEKHWELIARSFRHINETGSRVLYVPLICRTNFGNEESMVRWIKKGDNKYEHDFSIMDKYLDVAEKHMGKPKLVIFLAWDICLSKASLTRSLWGGETGKNTREGRERLLGKGPRVTALDPATGKTETIFLPRYEDTSAKALWQPLWTAVRQRMQRRGLERTMMLGVLSDLWPSKEEVAMLNDVTGGLPWASHAHAGKLSDTGIGNKILYKIADLGYAAHVYSLSFQVNPAKGRQYGWRRPALVAHFPRGSTLNMSPCVAIRHLPAFNITGGQRGAGRMGADMWRVMKDKRGHRAGAVYHRYPENNWRNLDIGSWFLAPGPDGAIATARYENLREGIQECEARILIEDALLDPAKKQRLGEAFGDRCQKLLDDYHRAMWKTVWSNDEDLDSVGEAHAGRNPTEGLWKALVRGGKKLPGYWDGKARKMRSSEAAAGRQWWFASNWQQRNKKLFGLAGEVAAKLGRK
jgi:Glycoside hydrolase 123, catalytic domain